MYVCVCACGCELRCFKQQIHFRFVINLYELHDPSELTGNSFASAKSSAQSESSSSRYSSALLCVRVMSEKELLQLENTILQYFYSSQPSAKTSQILAAKCCQACVVLYHLWQTQSKRI